MQVNDAPESQAEEAFPTAMLSTATLQPSATPQPTATSRPTDTPQPTAAPSETPLPTATPVTMVEVTAQQLVNVRRGPTTADDIVAVAEPGATYVVLGANGDGSWYNILLADGLEAWIAAFLVEEVTDSNGEQTDASASLPRERVVLRRDYSPSLGKNQPRFYQANGPLGDRSGVYQYARSQRGNLAVGRGDTGNHRRRPDHHHRQPVRGDPLLFRHPAGSAEQVMERR